MSSPMKTKKCDKENDCSAFSPTKGSPIKGPSKIAFFPLGNNRSTLKKPMDKNVIMEGLKPMDVNTSFDEEVPED